MIETTRRSLLTGLIALVAAPAIVRAGSLMSVKRALISLPNWPPVDGAAWEQVEWLGTYVVKFNEGSPSDWKLIRGPGFEERITPIAMAV